MRPSIPTRRAQLSDMIISALPVRGHQFPHRYARYFREQHGSRLWNHVRLQGNPWARIQGNTFQGSENTAGPWAYGDSTLTSESPSSGVGLSDNVEVGIVWNRFGGIPGLLLFYKHVGSKMRIGHTTDIPEPFGIGPGPVRIYVHENTFVNCGNISTRKPGTGWPW